MYIQIPDYCSKFYPCSKNFVEEIVSLANLMKG